MYYVFILGQLIRYFSSLIELKIDIESDGIIRR